jgi:sec-independent protein translocase protein TatA
MLDGLGLPEIILIVVVFLIFFGPKKIPEIAQGLGKGIREFRNSMKDIRDEIEREPAPPVDREAELLKREIELLKREQEMKQRTAEAESAHPSSKAL